MPMTIASRQPAIPARPSAFWGQEIAPIRHDQKMSQRRLARLAGVDRSCLLRFENGESRGNIDLLERLLGVLGYELDMMWRGFAGGFTGGFEPPMSADALAGSTH
jgi:transcriptional regulator with XRE-family HTH domain